MADSAKIESDPLLTLLTDALRAGPGSPEWHQAVVKLRAVGASAETDEYKLLLAAREHLESGKEYRSVRAGPEFTRKVMATIEQEAAGADRKGLSTGAWITLLAVIAIVAIAGFVAYRATRPGDANHAIDELAAANFFHPLLQTTFTQKTIAADWTVFGDAGPSPERGLSSRPSSAVTTQPHSGGALLAAPLPSDAKLNFEFKLVPARPESPIATLFIRDALPNDSGAGPGQELSILVQGTEAQVILPDGRVLARGQLQGTNKAPSTLTIRLSRDVAVIDLDGKRLYAGPHGLVPDKSRYLGIRFQSRTDARLISPGVTSVSVMKE